MGRVPSAPPDQQPARRDASMLLLTSLVEDSLDDGYARAAARRAAGEPPPRHGRALLVAGLVAVGLLLTTAAVQTRERAGATAEARDAVTAEIESRSAANDRLERQLDRERARAARERRAQLRATDEGAAVERKLTRLESVTGAGAVTGPGFVLRLDDAPADPSGADVDPRTDATDDGRVSDRDLQTLVNEVWASGAEAVAVNGQRLTALSAIRSAGEAILVDFRPITPPYKVSAVGPADMRASFVDGFGGSYLQVLRDYGIDYAVTDEDEVSLPASAGVTVRYALSPRQLPGATDDSSDGAQSRESTP
jgi:uncharacterized protein YlxW (UPF0749 family)